MRNHCLLVLLSATSILAGCHRESVSTAKTDPKVDSPVAEAPPADDQDKVSALKAAGFSLEQNSEGLVTKLSVVSDEPLGEALSNLDAATSGSFSHLSPDPRLPNFEQKRFDL